MAARKTRLKGQRTPVSTGSRLNKSSAKVYKAGKAKREKLQKSRLSVTNTAPKRPRTASTYKSKTSDGTNKSKTSDGSARNKLDAYEFDEGDECISGNSFVAFTPQNSQKVSKKKSAFTKVVSKSKTLKIKSKGTLRTPEESKRPKLTNSAKSVTFKRQSQLIRHAPENKKTSTPVLSESIDSSLKRRQSPRMMVPKLNLDLTVTPILPVASPASPPQPGMKKKRDPKKESFVLPPKTETLFQATPPCQTEKPKRQSSLRQVILAVPSSTPLTTLKEPIKVLPAKISKKSVDSGGDGRKRKNATKSSTPAVVVVAACGQQVSSRSPKRRKADQNKENSRPTVMQLKHPIKKKQAAEKSSRQVKARFTSTPVGDTQENAGIWCPGKEKMYCTPALYDSGISLGSDSSPASNSGSPSLPGFMEDEPLQSNLQDLQTSPLSGVIQEPESSLNKSSSKAYKPSKAKREQGRFSTSKIDAWVNAANESLQDVESFELVVE